MHKGIYKDNNNTWYIHTTIKGKSITIRGFVSKKDADENYEIAIEKWKREHNLSNENNYKEVVKEYLEYRSKIVRSESLRKDETQFKYYEPIFANDIIKNVFEPNRLKIVYKDIINNQSFSSNKKNILIMVFTDFAKYCNRTNRITDNTLNECMLTFIQVKEEYHHESNKRYISQNEINAILSDISKENDNLFYLAVSVLYSCGLRISELLGLTWEDIDLEKKKIKVQRQLLTNGHLTTTLKTTNSYREVPISNSLLTIMRKNCTKNNERVFPYSHTTFKRKLHICEKNAQISDYSCHEFRHTFCTNLARKCSNIADVTYCAKVSGHSVSMFLDTYCKSLDNELENKFF